ncbi:MAG: hypothetical protein ACI9OJ_000366 [Myxococcota bacterium]
MTRFLIITSVLLAGCSADPDAAASVSGSLLTSIDEAQDLIALSASDQEVYFLVSDSDTLLKGCHFGGSAHYRSSFAIATRLDTSLDWSTWLELIQPATRSAWSGALLQYPDVVHPQSGDAGATVWRVDGETGVTSAQLGALYAQLKQCAPAIAQKLVFVPHSMVLQYGLGDPDGSADPFVPWQSATSLSVSIVLVAGEAYGYLNVDPQDTASIAPLDIVLAERAPDHRRFAGLVSAIQPEAGDFDAIPTAVDPALWSDPSVRDLAGQLVRLSVTDDAVSIEPAALADANAFWDAQQTDRE